MYLNRFTIANPGLIIFMVDQSFFMDKELGTGRLTRSQYAADIVNRSINETILRFTDGIYTKESVYIVVIGYGSDERNDHAEILLYGSIKELLTPPKYLYLRKEEKRILDGVEGFINIVCDIPIWIEPQSVWSVPMASAFNLAFQIIDEWVNKDRVRQATLNAIHGQSCFDPVPFVINISQGIPSDDINVIKENVKKIKNIVCKDGNPLICNVHLSDHACLLKNVKDQKYIEKIYF